MKLNIDIPNSNKFTFTISVGNDLQKFYVKFPFKLYQSDIVVLKYYPLIIASNLSSFYKSINIETNFYVSKDEIKILEQMIIELKIDDYNKDRFKPTKINWIIKNKNKYEFKERHLPEFNKYTVINYMSGGKDSLLSYSILEEIDEIILPYMTKWANISFNQGMNKYLKEYLPIINIYSQTVSTNMNRQKNLYNTLSYYVNKSKDNNNQSGTYNLYVGTVGMLNAPSAILFTSRCKNANYIFTGDENISYKKINNIITCLYYPQSQLFYNKINKLNKINNINIRIASVLFSLNNIQELKLLKKYDSKFKTFSSCITQINKWCYKCDKCYRTYILFKILDFDLGDIGFDEKKLFNKHKYFKNKFNLDSVYLDNSEISNIFYHLNNKYFELPTKLQEHIDYIINNKIIIPIKNNKYCEIDEQYLKLIPIKYRDKISNIILKK